MLGRKWAEGYSRLHPSTVIQVTGGGSGTGFAALQNRQTDLAQASRRIRSTEIERCVRAFGRPPLECPVALDCVTVFVHARNPVSQLSLEQLRDIYTGRITRWDEVGGLPAPIVLYSRENSSGTYEFFKERVLLGNDFSAWTQTLAGTAQVVLQVSHDPNGIGYGGSSFGRTSHHLRLAARTGEPAVEPSESSVVTQAYPIWRHLYLYLDPKQAQGEILDFLDWVRGDEGQSVVREAGYYPLPRSLRPATPPPAP